MNDVFRALSDPTRREILELLRSGPRATVSRHLSVLKDAGLILAERDGQHVVYELNTTVFQEVVENLIKWLRPRRSNA